MRPALKHRMLALVVGDSLPGADCQCRAEGRGCAAVHGCARHPTEDRKMDKVLAEQQRDALCRTLVGRLMA